MPTSQEIDIREFEYGDGRAESLVEFVLQLQDLILDSSDVRDFLTDMASIITARLTVNRNHISCGITVIRNKRSITVASSDPAPGLWTNCRTPSATGPASLRFGRKP